jgi:hypothetical protein
MNRRNAIRAIVLVSAGSAALSSCLTSEKKNSLALKRINITGKQQELLAALTQSIIPTTDTPGAKEVKSHEFILRMIDDCASPADQQKFTSGMEQFEAFTQKKYGESFASLTDKQKKELLNNLQTQKEAPEQVTAFYKSVRGMTLQSYTGSEYYMTNVSKYNIIPKQYKGCVKVS